MKKASIFLGHLFPNCLVVAAAVPKNKRTSILTLFDTEEKSVMIWDFLINYSDQIVVPPMRQLSHYHLSLS